MRLAAVALLLFLAGCGARTPQAPSTATMGAAPAAESCGIAGLPDEALRRVNEARARARQCGGRRMPPAPPLRWDAALSSAASGHAADMAARNYFDHRSPEGMDLVQRVARVRYPWKGVAENLSAGNASVDEVVQGWLASPRHCENLMDAEFAEVGVACAARPGTQWGTYWAMVVGRR